MTLFDWVVIAGLAFLFVLLLSWFSSAEARAALELRVRVAASSAVVLFGLILALLMTRVPDPAHRASPEEDDDQEPNAILYCYHRSFKDWRPRQPDARDRQQALQRVVPEAKPAPQPEPRRVPTQPEPRLPRPVAKPAPAPSKPIDVGPSCRLHPRVLEKVLASIEQHRRAQGA